MQERYLKVGELARRTGVSVRALHHYDEIGLLKPALGGRGEQRLYGPREVARLARIRSLQGLGFSLEEIGACLDDPGFAPLRVVEMHLAQLSEQIELAGRLRDRLEAVARSLRAAEEPSVETFLQTIGLMSEMDQLSKYYTPEQMESLARRRAEVGEERIRAVEAEWQELFAAYRAAHERGDDPASEAVLALARRSQALIEEFTGGDAGIRASLGRMYGDNPDLPRRFGVEPDVWSYMGRASAALRAKGG
jgi:DNA-binding transcriptional MerR regulator